MADIQQKSIQDAVIKTMLNVWAQTKERHYVSIAGRSMLPLILDGDSLLITHGCDGMKRGDIVVFRCNGRLVAHRVIRKEIDKESGGVTYITKGDNVFQFDPPVGESEIIGRVLGIRKGEREILFDTAVWRAMGWVIAVGTVVISRPYSWCRDFTGRLPGFRSRRHRKVLSRHIQTLFLCIRKAVFFIFC
ncbi:MAG: signal peptidase I [Planctomycetes bacterium]|nr:signal peptidase I [Planctomycetota bacterium]